MRVFNFMLILAFCGLYNWEQLIGQTYEYLSYSKQDEVVVEVLQINNHFIFVGLIRENIDSLYHSYVFTLNETGDLMNEVIYNFDLSKNNSFEQILPLSDTSFFTIGDSWVPGDLFYGTLKLVKFNSNLQILSEHSFIFPEYYGAIGFRAKYDIDSNIIVFGHAMISYPPQGRRNMFIYKISHDGDSLRAKFFTEKSFTSCEDIQRIDAGHYWVNTTGFGTGLYAKYMVLDTLFNIDTLIYPPYRLAFYGSTQWDSDTSFYYTNESNYGSIAPDHSLALVHQKINDTGFLYNYWYDSSTYLNVPCVKQGISFQNKDSVFAGGTNNHQIPPWFGSYPSHYLLLQTDSLLNIRWEYQYGGDAYYELNTLKSTSDGGCILAGTRYDYTIGDMQRDIYILKVNKDGLLVSTPEYEPAGDKACAVFLNPGKDVLNISAPENDLEFQLYDLTGRLILSASLLKGSTSISMAHLPAGLYLYDILDRHLQPLQSGKWIRVGR